MRVYRERRIKKNVGKKVAAKRNLTKSRTRDNERGGRRTEEEEERRDKKERSCAR